MLKSGKLIRDPDLDGISQKTKMISPWPKIKHSTKFGSNPSTTFWDIPLTDRHTDRQGVSHYLRNVVGGRNNHIAPASAAEAGKVYGGLWMIGCQLSTVRV